MTDGGRIALIVLFAFGFFGSIAGVIQGRMNIPESHPAPTLKEFQAEAARQRVILDGSLAKFRAAQAIRDAQRATAELSHAITREKLREAIKRQEKL